MEYLNYRFYDTDQIAYPPVFSSAQDLYSFFLWAQTIPQLLAMIVQMHIMYFCVLPIVHA